MFSLEVCYFFVFLNNFQEKMTIDIITDFNQLSFITASRYTIVLVSISIL